MASDEFLRRIDQHMARGNEHMARGNELMEELRREHQLNRAAWAENTRVLNRVADVLIGLEQRNREMQAEIRAQTAEIKAHTAAFHRLIDRFDGGGASPATA